MFKNISLLIILIVSTNLAIGQRGQRFNPEQRAQEMKDSLLLSEAQTEKLKELFTINQKQMRSLIDSLSAINEEIRPAMKRFRRAELEEIKKYLTQEQWDEWRAILERRRSNKRGGARRGS